jgi:hypothetical protein
MDTIKPNPQYQLTHYDGMTIVTRVISRPEALAIDRQSADYFMSKTFGILSFREGKTFITHQAPWLGIGEVCISIIKACQFNPGEFLTPADLYEITNIWSLREPNNVSARLLSIRKAHRERLWRPDFFLSRRPMAVAWNKSCTWMWLERVASAAEQK